MMVRFCWCALHQNVGDGTESTASTLAYQMLRIVMLAHPWIERKPVVLRRRELHELLTRRVVERGNARASELWRDRTIQKGTRALISLWDSLMFGRVQGTRPNISEPHSEISTRVPFCIEAQQCHQELIMHRMCHQCPDCDAGIIFVLVGG